jgi:hypothetical protein
VAPAALVPNPVGNPLFGVAGQGHLRGAGLGINAPAAWEYAGGDGAGVGLMDLEADWHFSHEDLLARAPTLGVSPVWGQHSGDRTRSVTAWRCSARSWPRTMAWAGSAWRQG